MKINSRDYPEVGRPISGIGMDGIPYRYYEKAAEVMMDDPKYLKVPIILPGESQNRGKRGRGDRPSAKSWCFERKKNGDGRYFS